MSGDLRAAFRGALLGVVVGDALGAPLEGHRGPVPARRLRYLDADDRLGFTDDTAMTVVLAESLLRCRGLDEDDLAAAFADAHHREPHRGYGPGTAGLLARIRSGEDWRVAAPSQFGGAGSHGNGAAMRTAPIALWCAAELRCTAALARRAAQTTHAHPVAIEAAAVQAAAIAHLIGRRPSDGLDPGEIVAHLIASTTSTALRERLDTAGRVVGSSPAEAATAIGTGVAAVEAVPAAVWAVLSNATSFVETIRAAIALGGDTDTIASMAGAMSGALLGDGAIPVRWLERTEGVETLGDLADRLVDRSTGHER